MIDANGRLSQMGEKNITQAVSERIVNFDFGKIPTDVVIKLKTHILDTMGVMLGGSLFEASKIALSAMSELGGKQESTVVGHNIRMPSTSAAFVNGVSAHGLELDDGHSAALVHPGAVVLPATLALGERVGVDGKELMVSVLLGYEIAIRVGMAVFPWHRRRGFHPTGTCGTLGAAVAAGRILGLDDDEMASCLGLAGTQAASLREGHGPEALMMKKFHAGKASQNGILAAILSKHGFTAPHTILEGENGFCKALSEKAVLSKITDELGERFVTSGCYIKPYAACRHAHAPIDSLLRLKREHGFSPNDVQKITLRIYREGSYFSSKEPLNYLDAQFSIPYCLSVALHDDAVLLEQFSESRIRDPSTLDLARRIDVIFDPEMDKTFTETKKRAHTLQVELRDGRRLLEETPYPKGEPENPLTHDQVKAKFNSLASMAANHENVHRLLRGLDELEKIEQIEDLMALLGRVK